ncbi:LysR substrate-binding domain-containing protein [Rhizobium sp. CNPSo 4062]|uniref:LysR family transcriptional regulator n=1 Tax=Rhizobium sp. CNPSo 4062 TaxID=3021410 RepID=UPI00254C797B|nr:LysR family transcriptional regulator [Rhizobium sp. CNPSo 4062]MDK4700668.1 LysR substrate-binding domain-containing protein [Rhizobium sp. CNPSo 4062]
MDTLTSLRVFCAVAEFKSFTAAADRLGLSPAMASKHVMHLENRLGTRLLNRTSRHVSMTESGMLYFNQARQMLDGLDEVEAAVSNVTVMPRGTLRLSAPVWAANTLVARMIAEYHQRYPDVRFDMDLSGRIVNLVDEGFDLALRATSPERLDPNLIARPLTRVAFHLVGSPAYLSRTGRPRELADLNGHALLAYSGMNANGSIAVAGQDGTQTVNFRPVMQSENEIMLHLAALEGMGLVFLPMWMAQNDISDGRLEMVLPKAVTFDATLHAVYPSRKYLSAKVRTFIDFLASRPNLCLGTTEDR